MRHLFLGSLGFAVEEEICGGEFGAERQIHPHIYYPLRQLPENLFLIQSFG